MSALLGHSTSLLSKHTGLNRQMRPGCNSRILSRALIRGIALFGLSLTICHDWLF